MLTPYTTMYVEKLLRLPSEVSVIWHFAILIIIVIVSTNSVVVGREIKIEKVRVFWCAKFDYFRLSAIITSQFLRSNSSSSSGATGAKILAFFIYFLPFNPVLDAFYPIICFRNS